MLVRSGLAVSSFVFSHNYGRSISSVGKGPCFNQEISSQAITEETLSLSSLRALLEGRCLAVCVPDFTSRKVCEVVSEKLLKIPYEYYRYADKEVGRYGLSFSEVGNSENLFSRYYSESISSIESLRKVFAPYLSPIDKLRLELEEKWPKGAVLESFDSGHKMFVGLCRVIDARKEVLPHQDVVHWDAVERPLTATAQIVNQLAANVYLQMPSKGGELELWDFGIPNQVEYQQLAEKSYGIARSKLPDPVLVIKPRVGDLILFCPRRLHCIRTGSDPRVAMSSFIGFRGEDYPLSYWS